MVAKKMDLEHHLYLRSFTRPASRPILKALLLAIIVHSLALAYWYHRRQVVVAEIPQWMNIRLVAGFEENKVEKPQQNRVREIPLQKTGPKKTAQKQERIKKEKMFENKVKSAATTVIKADSRPYRLQNPRPVYPALARRRGMQGRVVLSVRVSASGTVDSVSILESSGFTILDRSALNCVRKWHFVPARKGEKNIASWLQLPVRFSLKDS